MAAVIALHGRLTSKKYKTPFNPQFKIIKDALIPQNEPNTVIRINMNGVPTAHNPNKNSNKIKTSIKHKTPENAVRKPLSNFADK